MRQILLSALLASSLALPAAAQMFDLEGVLIEPRHPTESDRIRLTVVGQGACVEFHPVYDDATGSVVVQLGGEDCIGTPHWSNPKDGSSGWGHARRLARDSGAFWFFSPDNTEITVKILDGHASNGHPWVFIASMTDLQLEVEISRTGGPVTTYVQTAGANRNFIDINATFDGPPQPVSDPPFTTPEIVLDPEHPTSADPVHVEVAAFNAIAFTGMQGNSLVFNDVSLPPPPAFPRRTAEATVGPLAPGIYRAEVRTECGIASCGVEFGRTFEVTAASAALRLRDAEGGTFDIEVSYRLPGETGFAIAPGVPITRDSAYFYFFDRENVEVTAKVLDGRKVNKHWWVFLANMTTVELEIEVTHCPPQAPPAYCITKTYVQPPGKNQNFLDTGTFFGEL